MSVTREREALLDQALAYVRELQGASYSWWRGGPFSGGAPCWAHDGPPPDPERVRREGLFCAAVGNLMLRSAGLSVPEYGEWTGGIAAWGVEYVDRRRPSPARPFDLRSANRRGTIVLRRYRDVEDQGHLAVVLENGHVLQSFAWNYPAVRPGCNSNWTLAESHDGGFYEWMLFPEDWLARD